MPPRFWLTLRQASNDMWHRLGGLWPASSWSATTTTTSTGRSGLPRLWVQSATPVGGYVRSDSCGLPHGRQGGCEASNRCGELVREVRAVSGVLRTRLSLGRRCCIVLAEDLAISSLLLCMVRLRPLSARSVSRRVPLRIFGSQTREVMWGELACKGSVPEDHILHAACIAGA